MWQRTSNCSDGTQIRLDCSSIFLMDPLQSKHDNFTVIHEEGTAWLLPDIDYEKIPLDR